MVSETPTASTNNQCMLLRLYEEAAEGMDMYAGVDSWSIELFSDASVEWPLHQRKEERMLGTRLGCLVPSPVVCASRLAVVGGQVVADLNPAGRLCVCRVRPSVAHNAA